jgi:hypothetical protein
MRVSSKIGITVAAFATAALALPGIASAAAAAYQNVIVANDSSHPVPTKAIGTTAVSGSVDVTSGSVSVSGGSIGISGPVDATGSEVTIGNDAASPVPVTVQNQATTDAPQPWQQVVRLTFGESGGTYGSGFGFLDAGALTIERISTAAPSGNQIVDLEVVELCDFTDGKNGYGGSASIPLPPSASSAMQNIDHLTQMNITPDACFDVAVRLRDVVTAGSSVSVTLSGTTLPAEPTQQAAASGTALRSLDDPSLRAAMDPRALAAARAAAALQSGRGAKR